MTNAAPVSFAKQGSNSRPAEPLLASQLISDEELDNLLDSVCDSSGTKETSKKLRLGTGLKSLDDIIEGGFEGGRVVEISGEAGAGASEVCSTFLVSCLLQYENSTAAVVDTTGNFDIIRLYTLIIARLTRQPNTLASLCSTIGLAFGASIEDVAAKILDRVKIMRVFDFVGVKEAVGEIKDEIEGRKIGDITIGKEEKKKKKKQDEQPVREEIPPEKEPKVKRTYVADSEDEEDEEEMLFESEAATTTVPTAPAVQIPDVASKLEQQAPSLTFPKHASEAKSNNGTQSKLKFILIDNLTQVLNPLLKKDVIQGNALACEFLPNLTMLTKTHALHTILANPATLPRTTSPTRSLQPPSNRNQAAMREQQKYQQGELAPHPSMFASNRVVPGLNGLLARHADVQILVSRLPRRKMDARVYYADDSVGGARKRGVEMVGVLEVMGDRWGGRTGAWGTFCEGKDGIRDV